MANLDAQVTNTGSSILTSSLKSSVNKYILIGDNSSSVSALDTKLTTNVASLTYSDISSNIYHEDSIDSSYYDDNGDLTFEINFPVSTNFTQFLYGVGIISDDGAGNKQLVSIVKTPKVQLGTGMGGLFIIKLNIKGVAGTSIFTHNQYITKSRANTLIATAKDELKDGVNDKGNTLKKLYELITNSYLKVSSFKSKFQQQFPIGSIIIWSGNTIPSGWALCDGNNNTPNLVDRFIMGSNIHSIGGMGGSSSHTHSVSATVPISGSVGSTTLSKAQMPTHQHAIYDSTRAGSSSSYQLYGNRGSSSSYDSGNTTYTGTQGGSASHTHSISGSASFNVNTSSGNNLPPYYKLAYIMYKGV